MNTEIITEKFINSSKEVLKLHPQAQLFLSWADLSIQQGAEPQQIFYEVLKQNIKGGNHDTQAI